MHKTLQGVQKKFENNLTLKEEIALSVQKVVEDLQSPKYHENRPSSEETCGIRSINLGASALEGWPRENKDLRGVVESGVDPSH